MKIGHGPATVNGRFLTLEEAPTGFRELWMAGKGFPPPGTQLAKGSESPSPANL